MDAALLVERHLVVLELVAHVGAEELPLQELVRHPVGLRHAGGWDGTQPRQEGVVLRVLPLDLRQRRIAELRVVAIVANRGRPLWRALETGLIELLEQRILLRHTLGHGGVLGMG